MRVCEMDSEKKPEKRNTWLPWLISVLGWLVCASFCLLLTINLESWPDAYDILFPAVLLMLFGNIFVFLFLASRYGTQPARLGAAVARLCLGEGLLLAGLYVLGRFAIAA